MGLRNYVLVTAAKFGLDELGAGREDSQRLIEREREREAEAERDLDVSRDRHGGTSRLVNRDRLRSRQMFYEVDAERYQER